MATASLLVAGTHLDEGLELQRAGKIKEADRSLRAAITDLRGSGNQKDLLRALSIESWVSVSLGNYPDGIEQAGEAVELRRALHDERHVADDLNTIALANQNLGRYPAAIAYFEEALNADRAAGDREGEITRLSNIGGIYFFEGQYLEALKSYENAKAKVDAAPSEPWTPRRRQIVLGNLAAVYQRLGQEETALDLYRSLMASRQAMPARERAQLLLNQGALYRRLGDPFKAVELYRSAQDLYAVEHYSDGEIGALRNTGIARAVDLNDLPGALDAFGTALGLAEKSSNQRGIVQASLYRGETLRRLHRFKEAESDAEKALAGARTAGLVEEQWKALYLLGRVRESGQDTKSAGEDYIDAIALIESMRSGLRPTTLRTEFLADKHDVYDALITLRLKEHAPAEELFRWIEQSRARTLADRAALGDFRDVRATQSRLGQGSMILDYWVGPDSIAVVWISAVQAGVVRLDGQVQGAVEELVRSLETGDDRWRELSRTLGDTLLAGITPTQHLIIVPDGPLSEIPFEALTVPGGNALLMERSDVSYLPSAQFLKRVEVSRRTLLPWQKQLAAWGDPPVATSDSLAQNWQRLAASADEVRSIQHILPGRSEIHLGDDARKRYLEGSRLENVPLLLFSTHAIVDPENQDRSRILLASDYIFQGDVYGFDLKGVCLVTVSACDTARGKTVRGEGVQAFSRAFLAAGAESTVTSLWRVADEPTASFMKQFYYFLAQGQGKSQALRAAKLELLHSKSGLANPRYWAAFVLTGDALSPVPLALSWSVVMLVGGAILGLGALVARWRLRAGRTALQKAVVLTDSNPQ